LNELVLEVIPYSDNSEFSGEKKIFDTLIKLVISGEKSGVNRPKILEDNDPLQNLVARCWAANPEDRPTFRQIFKEAPWEKAMKVYAATGSKSSEVITSFFGGKPDIPYKDWVKNVAATFEVKDILGSESDQHYKALSALNDVANISGPITIEDSTRFAVWTAGISNKANELTNVIYKIVTQAWFYGVFSYPDSVARLSLNMNKENGVYLVRWDKEEKKWFVTYNAKNDKNDKQVSVHQQALPVNQLKELEKAVETFVKENKLKKAVLPQRYEALIINEKFQYLSSEGCYFTEDAKQKYRGKNYIYLM